MYPQPPTPPMHYHHTFGFYQSRPYQPLSSPPKAAPISLGHFLENFVKSMTTSSLQFQQSTQASLKNLELQVSLMVKEISEIKAQKRGEKLEVALKSLKSLL